MNKKVNTVLFVLGATFFNIIIAVLSFVVFLLLYTRFVMDLLPETSRPWGFTIVFVLAITVSFIVYRYAIKFFMFKIKIDKYFDPLFVSKYKKR